ncbi:hypothetical protein K490DRAFT_53286 [Saccharata proteae CBS 121410]|uniref:Uncharacterized protein n=1 Tax=Saccharata proteae CBS 121410 TaxID=1314787 RepID=A0A9P4M0C6_9PEZI|nr:hypothetical protein K490DRAFT_53286 [Saccharata proteae CBS 121410]
MALAESNALIFTTSIFALIIALIVNEFRNRELLRRHSESKDPSSLNQSIASFTETAKDLTSSIDNLHTTINDLRTTIHDHTIAQTHATTALTLCAQLLETRVSTTGPNTLGSDDYHSATGNTIYTKRDEDADLYRRKVEAMEGLRRILEANPGGIGAGEDEVLYRRRVEALEGLMRVLDAQPSASDGEGAVMGSEVYARRLRALYLFQVDSKTVKGSVNTKGNHEDTTYESIKLGSPGRGWGLEKGKTPALAILKGRKAI